MKYLPQLLCQNDFILIRNCFISINPNHRLAFIYDLIINNFQNKFFLVKTSKIIFHIVLKSKY